MPRILAVSELPAPSWDWLKPITLLFDAVALHRRPGREEKWHIPERFRAETAWLLEHGLIIWTHATKYFPKNLPEYWNETERALVFPEPGPDARLIPLSSPDPHSINIGEIDRLDREAYRLLPTARSIDERNDLFNHLWLRAAAATIESQGDEATTISSMAPPAVVEETASSGSVLSVALRHMPEPDSTTPWESILDFRRDSDTRALLVRFRRWLRNLGKQGLSPAEISEEIEYLHSEYENYMKVHALKVNRGIVQTFITMPFEMAENLIKLKWAAAARKLFTLGDCRVQLLEAELKAPGRDIAYLRSAQRLFRRTA